MEDTEKRDTQNDWGKGGERGGGIGGGCQRDVNEEMPSYAIDTHLTGHGHIVFRQTRGHEACGAGRCGAVWCGVVRGSVLRSGQPHWEPDWTREEGREDGS